MKLKAISGATGLSILISGITSMVGLTVAGPWVVPLFGVSGAILLARFRPYRPYFIVIAALLLAMALRGMYSFRKTYAADPVIHRRFTWLNLFVAIGVLMLAFAIFVGPLERLLQGLWLS